ncbi:tRNA 2-selenouridine(34) synthase MnmH [Oxalobacter vibrioformis]|uniref:tRNA 2-selenouridine(34) synthase MnmH n=1 Tax=Oxalobacter vibrioformis TaxID=933080 RepID=A0A9E9LVN1_9BURK|nr:tRNA 2-selenouridine(34) synthase MnmH [Oxalobacter vibrioformis]WAW10026.1 tRNA 2-selenouridine(34) synthase MnmH [Oxalobacter vibrioformis]
MPYLAVNTVTDFFARIDRYDAIIDVRSPAEYAEDHIPGAINCPVLNDEERARVGTLYKQTNPFEAKKVGAALVAKNIASHIEQRFIDMPRQWKPLIYCWRGGNRSGAMAHILSRIGWHAEQLEGGYKKYRRQVIDALDETPAHYTFNVICGTTGSGKSRLLQVLAGEGAQVLDLEQLAAHRGSVLGNIPAEPQPSQKCFESHLWDTLRRFDPARTVFVESESKKVGMLRVPEALMERIRASQCTAVNLSRPNRMRLLMEDYVHFVRDPLWLNERLSRLTLLHGNDRIAHWHELALSGQMETLIDELLADHYDPLYERSIHRNFLCAQDARTLELSGIAEADFRAAAQKLMAG